MEKWNKLREECGVFGAALSGGEAAGLTYNALLALQHRGQEGAGIAVAREGAIFCRKKVGLVSEVFDGPALESLGRAGLAIGHVRYSTTGQNIYENTQPMVIEYLRGRIAAAHNGNIVNAPELKRKLTEHGCVFKGTGDTEVIAALIAYEALRGSAGTPLGPGSAPALSGAPTNAGAPVLSVPGVSALSGTSPDPSAVEAAVVRAAKQLVGAFSLVVLTPDRVIALRDGTGFRPLCLGKSAEGYAVASESCALDSAGFTFVRDIRPGEMVVITPKGAESRQVLPAARQGFCVFEYVYFARTDSVLDGQSVYQARYEMGRMLAAEHPANADVVCGVPDSGLEAAAGYAAESGIPLVSGFVKNRYIGRSFIFPSQAQREAAVRLKLNPLAANVAGRRVVLVDDSIVRGTTSRKIIASIRAAGAREVHMRISSPPFRHACHFGTDIDDERALIANHMTLAEVARHIGADSLGYISPAGLKTACIHAGLPLCMGCFTGEYPLPVGPHTKTQFETR